MTIFRCPVCELCLHRAEKTYTCENNHSFDIAKQGYVNLLLAHHRGSNHAGDSKAMVKQRRKFLSSGYYAPLADALADTVQRLDIQAATPNLLDVGCGEGYYLAHIAQALGETWHYYGVDISKEAIKLAAKRPESLSLAVANSHYLPVQNHSVDILLMIFAPYNVAELVRVCKPPTRFILVTPHTGHLRELREHLYDDVRPYDDDRNRDLEAHFIREQVDTVEAHITLTDSEHIQALLQMTPFYWHSPAEKQKALLQRDALDLTLSFAVSRYVLKQ